MIKEKRDSVNELIAELEVVLQNPNDASNSMRIQKAIDVLKKAMTVQVGDRQITFLSNDAVDFKFYDNIRATAAVSQELPYDENKYVDTKTVAEYYGVTSETVRNWIQKNVISGHQVGPRGRYLIPREEFEYMKQRREHQKDETEQLMKDFLGKDYTENWEIEIDE
ncbi:helix-turn-helix domain-containing protein [Ectobacillus ponti]|uniref:Helix-turn-helix domain-containing protein n=1 Tax=Ectobacillus ponti TaxID=2961894 RepID=A0AA41X7Q3_9BACI|nr:helix-turn-helix domain-containing protein [Ectobacillus ponti]MCP8970461.1 helix-turn-helix domain-containing protein [Ectobacillus ponti]